MPTDSNPTVHIPPASAGAQAGESTLARLAWMRELEASLNGSRKALLSLDLAGIERGTSEQVSLIREFDAIGRPPREDGVPGLAAHGPELERQLRRSGTRIVMAARLQAALLARPDQHAGRPLRRLRAVVGADGWRTARLGSRVTLENEAKI
jgi:hypothetical protein